MKRQANILSSIIQNFDTVERIIETSANASGSALAENEKYLDSIQGKIDLLNNALQTMWSNALNDDLIKGFVSFGTILIQLIDKVGLLQSALLGIVMVSSIIRKESSNELLGELWQDIKTRAQTVTYGKGVVKDKKDTSDIDTETESIKRNTAEKQKNAEVTANASVAEDQNTSDKLENASATDAQTSITRENASAKIENANATQISGAAEDKDTEDTVENIGATKVDTDITKENTSANIENANSSKVAAQGEQIDTNATNANIGATVVDNGTTKANTATNSVNTGSQAVNTVSNVVGVVAATKTASNVGKTTKAMSGLSKGIGLVATAGKGLLKVIGGFLKSNWIILAITLLPTVISWLTNLKSAEEKLAEQTSKLKEEWEGLYSTISGRAKEFSSLKKSAEELIPKYAELAQGVNKFGENVSLTDDDYKEFISLNNQLAEMFPELVVGYDENGNAILSLSGDVDTLTKSIKALLEAKRLEMAEDIADTMPDVMKNITDTEKIYKREKKRKEKEKKEIEDLINMGSDTAKQAWKNTGRDTWEQEWKESVQDGVLNVREELVKLLGGEDSFNNIIQSYVDKNGTVDWVALLNGPELQAALNGTEKQINDYSKRIESTWSRLNQVMSQWMLTNSEYNIMDSDAQNIAQKLVSSFDFGTIDYGWYHGNDEQQARDYIEDNIIKPISNATPEVRDAMNNLLSIDESSTSYEIYQSLQKALLDAINNLPEETQAAIKIAFKINDTTDYDTYIEHTKKILQDEYDDKVKELSLNDLKIVGELKVEDGVLLSWDQLIAKIEEVKQSDWAPDVKWEEISKGIDDIQSAYTALSDAIEQYNSTGYITLDNLQALLSLKPEYLALLQMENGQLSLNQAGMEALIQTRLNEAKATAIDNAMTELEAIAAGNAAQANASIGVAANNATPGLSNLATWLGNVAIKSTEAANAGADFMKVWGAAVERDPAAAQKVLGDLKNQLNLIDSLGSGLKTNFKPIVSGNKSSGGSGSKDSGSGTKDEDKRLENIQKKYAGKIKNLENQKTWLENEISREEEIGLGVSKAYYEEQIKLNDKLLAEYESQRKKLIELKDAYPEGSEKWYEVTEAIWDMDHAIQELTIDSIKASKSILNLYKDIFDKIGEAYDDKISISDDRISSIQNYAELLDLQGGVATKGLYDKMIAESQGKLDAQWEKFNTLEESIQQLRTEANTATPGSDEWKAFELEREKAIIAASAEQRQLKLDIQETTKSIEQQKQEFKDLATQLWDDVRTAYDNRDKYYQNQIDLNDKYIGKLETLGINVPDEAYQAQIDSIKAAQVSAYEDYAQARKEMLDYEYIYNPDSQEYIDKYNEVIELHQKALDYENQVLEYQQKIFDNQIDRFNQVIDRITNVTKRMQNVSSLLERNDVATENGDWTEEGLTRLGMAYQQMEYYKQSSDEITKKMKETEKAYKRGEISEKKYYETMQALEDQQWDMINSYEDMKDSIIDMNEARIDMVEDGLNKEIDAYSELIDLKKEELQAERDLYDFKKDTQKQAKDITALERRIASMSGSTDAATIAERTKLQAELKDAKESLNDSYRNHAYDSISDALDSELETYTKNSEDYIKSLREQIKETDLIIEQTYQNVLHNTDIVLETITNKANEYGFYIDDYLTSPWENATSESINFKTYANQQIDDIYEYVNSMRGSLEESLGGPYTALSKDAWGNPLYEFSWYAKGAIDTVIADAENKQDKMKSALDGGFEQSKSSIQGWGSAASEAVDNVINKFTDPENGLIAALNKTADKINNMPNYDGGYTAPTTNNSSNSGGGGTITKPTGGGNVIKSGAAVTALQKYLNQYWNTHIYNATGSSQLSVDGSYGPNTISTVKSIQEKLKKDGFYTSSIDGKWGTGTVNAVKSYYDSEAKRMSKYPSAAAEYRKKKDVTPVAMFAKGTMGTKKDQFAITDESWIGEEITLAAGKNGQIQYLKKGSAVLPSDIANNLIEWGKLSPNMTNIDNMSGGVQLMSNYVNKPEIKIDVENFLKVDRVDQDSLPQLEKLMDKKIDTFAKQLNASIRKFK